MRLSKFFNGWLSWSMVCNWWIFSDYVAISNKIINTNTYLQINVFHNSMVIFNKKTNSPKIIIIISSNPLFFFNWSITQKQTFFNDWYMLACSFCKYEYCKWYRYKLLNHRIILGDAFGRLGAFSPYLFSCYLSILFFYFTFLKLVLKLLKSSKNYRFSVYYWISYSCRAFLYLKHLTSSYFCAF